MTAERILGCKQPGDLFSCPEKLDEEFKALSKEWHPDKNKDPRAASIMATINQLRDLAEKQMENGAWEASDRRVMKLDNGKSLLIEFEMERPFELGNIYVCKSSVVFIVKKEHKDLVDNYRRMTKSFKFASARMKEDMDRCLPHVTHEMKTADGDYVMAIQKTEDVLLLRHVLDYYGKIPARHVAWIMNTLYNNCCYMRYMNAVQCGITLDNYFISPKMHSGLMLGGWWYTLAIGEKVKQLPADVYSVMPASCQLLKQAGSKMDLESVKLIGRTLLGDDAPKPMISFLDEMSSDDAIEEYRLWGEVLKESFGPRKFVHMDIDYKKIKEKK